MAKNAKVIHEWVEIRPAKTGNGTVYTAKCGVKIRLREGEEPKQEFGQLNCLRCQRGSSPSKYREGF